MESLDNLPDISFVPVDLVPRVDAFPRGPSDPPPHPSLLKAYNARKDPRIRPKIGGKGGGTLSLPSEHPRPFSINQVSTDEQAATVKRGPGRPRKNPKPDSPFSLSGYLCQLQQQPPLQLLQQHGTVELTRRKRTSFPSGSCSEVSESQVSIPHTSEAISLSLEKSRRTGESYECRPRYCQSNVCNSHSFKALLPADMSSAPILRSPKVLPGPFACTFAPILPFIGKEAPCEQASIIDPNPIPPANEVVHTVARQVGGNAENVNVRIDLCHPSEEFGPCAHTSLQHRIEEGQALPSQADAPGILLHSDAMLDPSLYQDPSHWVRLGPDHKGFQGIHNATEAGSEIMYREGDSIDVVAKDPPPHACKDSQQGFADNLPPEVDSLALPPLPLLHAASQCHFDPRGLHCSDSLVKGAEMVDAVAIIQSPRQPKAKDTLSSRSPGACSDLDSQWACGSSSLPVVNEEKRAGECTRENMKTNVVEYCEGAYTLRAHSQPGMDGYGADQGCSGRQPVCPSAAQATLPASTLHGQKASTEFEEAQQVDRDEFHRFLSEIIRSPSPSPFLERQMDFPMDLPTLEHTLNASPSKHEASDPSGSADLQVFHRAPALEAQAPCFGLCIMEAEPVLPSHATSRENKVLPHAPSCGPASGEVEKALGANTLPSCEDFLANSQAGCPEGKAEDISTSKECLPQMQGNSMFQKALPFFVGPPFYLANRCLALDSNLAKIVPHEYHCKEHAMESPLAAAPGKGWDMEAFTGVDVGEDELGDMSKSAHGTYQESRRLRPAVADGEERVLSKDMLQSVYHLPINEAAAQLQVGVTVLKKFCRQHNVGRWPYRKLVSVDKLVRSVEEQSEQNPAGANYIMRELGHLKQEIYNDPEVQLDDKIKKLRQANFKMLYKQRLYAGKHAMGPGVLQKLGKGCKQNTRNESHD